MIRIPKIYYFIVILIMFIVCILFMMNRDTKNLNNQNILFAGASLTASIPGVSFVDMLKKQYPDYNYTIKGFPGATMQEIIDKTLLFLDKDSEFDKIILDVGHNDIILPILRQKPGIHIVGNSKTATSADDFDAILKEGIKNIKEKTDAQIFILTLGCLGENLTLKSNQERVIINEKIKMVASELNLEILDIASKFEEKLFLQKTDYFLKNNFNLFIDVLFSKIDSWNDHISKSRGLLLTIDGVHLNREGAEIYSDIIVRALQ